METAENPSSSSLMLHQSRDGEKSTPDLAASMQQATVPMNDSVSTGEEHEYLTGAKLLLTMFSITLVGFLLLLDTSIVSTVS